MDVVLFVAIYLGVPFLVIGLGLTVLLRRRLGALWAALVSFGLALGFIAFEIHWLLSHAT